MLSVMELQAVADGLLDPSEAVKLDRHAGGRPKGVKNQRDSLDKALQALLEARSGMTPREIAESEYRISVMLDGRHRPLRKPRIHGKRRRAAWRAYVKREADIEYALARATPAEKRVVAVYKGQEDRVGKARKRRVKDEDGRLVPGKTGYPVEPLPDCMPFTDNGLRMEKHVNGWLAPIPESGGLQRAEPYYTLDDECNIVEVRGLLNHVPDGGHANAYIEPLAYGKPWPNKPNLFPSVAEGYAAWLSDACQESDWSGCPLDEAGEFIPAWYEHKTSRRKRLQRVGFRLLSEKAGCYSEMVPLDYACCKATMLAPKSNGPAVVHKKPLDSAAACNRAKRVPNKHGKAGEPMYHVEGAYRRAPLASYVRRRSAGEVTPTGKDDAWCNGVHLDDLLKIAARDEPLPFIPLWAVKLPPRKLDVVHSMADAKPTSIVWFRDYEKPVRRVDLEHGLLDSIKLWAKFAVYDLYGTFEMQ
jgi:hypothetical protein